MRILFFGALVKNVGGGGTFFGMQLRRIDHTYNDIICIENLLEAWREFAKGKRNRRDAQIFERNLMTNLFSLHEQLAEKTYRHAGYQSFVIHDPKTRHIHKACVTDRVVHRAVYRLLYPAFDRIFIADSFSCRTGKGTHKALDRFCTFARRVSHNHTRTCWVLKCDIKQFFASVHHDVLYALLCKRILCEDARWLLQKIITSFSFSRSGAGMPLGNLTSQLFANVYMNAFDQYVKHQLKPSGYLRYADDFVLLSDCRNDLEALIFPMKQFLSEQLHLQLHPQKVFLKTFASGVDFLGWVHFLDHRVLRASTRRRMLRKTTYTNKVDVKASYLGLLGHGNAYRLARQLTEQHSAL